MEININELRDLTSHTKSAWRLEQLIKFRNLKDTISYERLSRFINFITIDDEFIELVCKRYTVYHGEFWNPLAEEFKEKVVSECQIHANEIYRLNEFDKLSMFNVNVFGVHVIFCLGYETYVVLNYNENINAGSTGALVSKIASVNHGYLNTGICLIKDEDIRSKNNFEYAKGCITNSFLDQYASMDKLPVQDRYYTEKNMDRTITHFMKDSLDNIEKFKEFTKKHSADPIYDRIFR